MGFNRAVEQGGRELVLFPSAAITAAATVTSIPFTMLPGVKHLVVQGNLVYGSGGTTVKAFIQTTLDGGVTWIDIACLAFATANAVKVSKLSISTALAAAITPTDGTLTDNTILDGLLGDQFRVKVISTGTYVDTTLAVTAIAKG